MILRRLLLVATLLGGCDGAPKTEGLEGLGANELKSSIGGMMTVVGVAGNAARPGAEIEVQGFGLEDGVEARLDGTPLTKVTAASDRMALRLPDDVKPGMHRLHLEKNGERAMLSLFVQPAVVPLATGAAETYCRGLVFVDGAGSLVEGLRTCVTETTCPATGL